MKYHPIPGTQINGFQGMECQPRKYKAVCKKPIVCQLPLEECTSCIASRKVHPEIREQVETEIVRRFQNENNLIIISFGDSGLFQTAQIMKKLPAKRIELHLIDPCFGACVMNDSKDSLLKEAGIDANEFYKKLYQMQKRLDKVQSFKWIGSVCKRFYQKIPALFRLQLFSIN
jgi:hypothetical protein